MRPGTLQSRRKSPRCTQHPGSRVRPVPAASTPSASPTSVNHPKHREMTGTGSFFVVFLSGPLATKSSAATLLPPPPSAAACRPFPRHPHPTPAGPHPVHGRSEEHTSELQSLMRNSYAVFCLKKKKINNQNTHKPLN